MAWIILEGLDRTGKSTVSEHYKEKGYHVHHMSAPDKKYMQPGYAGPSYFEELVDLYMKYDNHDVVFDRSPYGEQVWPHVYGRDPQLSEDDYEFLREYEENNDVVRILMHDTKVEEHWKRCVENNEPLNRGQFNAANEFFKNMGEKYGFIKKTLPEIQRDFAIERQNTDPQKQRVQPQNVESPVTPEPEKQGDNSALQGSTDQKAGLLLAGASPERKLEIANAINKIMSKPLIKQKGDIYERIESDLRDFLRDKLDECFGKTNVGDTLDNLDLQILKQYCNQVKKKMEEK